MATPEEKRAFAEAYADWQQTARGVKMALRKVCLEEDLRKMKDIIMSKLDVISELYELMQCNCTATRDMAKKMDACYIITSEICDLVR